MRTLYVLTVEFSEPASVVLAKGRDDFAGHRARMSAFHAQGTPLMSGAFQAHLRLVPRGLGCRVSPRASISV